MISLCKARTRCFSFSSMMLHWSTGASVLSLIDLSCISPEAARAWVVQQQNSPLIRRHSCRLHATSATQWKSRLCPDNFGPTFLGFRRKRAWHIAGAYKLILHFISRLVYIKPVCIWRWRANSRAAVWEQFWAHSTAATPPSCLLPPLTSSFLGKFLMLKAEEKPLSYEHFSAWRIFCSELLSALLSCVFARIHRARMIWEHPISHQT